MAGLAGKSSKEVMKVLKEARHTLLYKEVHPPAPTEHICNTGPGPITEVTNMQPILTRRYIQIRDYIP